MLKQVHIAGVQRTGKSELARNLISRLQDGGLRPVILDIDETRLALFGPDETCAMDSAEKGKRMAASYACVQKLLIPKILAAGGTPIFTATHSRRVAYETARDIAKANRAELKFIMLERPSLEETHRRAQADKASMSDIHDLTNLDQRKIYDGTVARMEQEYAGFREPHLFLRQGTPDEMADEAAIWILEGTHRCHCC